MPPNTRVNDCFTPLPGPEKGHLATIQKRTRFFSAYDSDYADKAFRQFVTIKKLIKALADIG
jgi:hypothetical protein